jgi:hypothetical protein
VNAFSNALAAVTLYELLETCLAVGETTSMASETLCLDLVSFSLIYKFASILGDRPDIPYIIPGGWIILAFPLLLLTVLEPFSYLPAIKGLREDLDLVVGGLYMIQPRP